MWKRILNYFEIQIIYFMIDHYNDVIMGAIASRITSLTIVNSTVYSDADQRKHQSSASLAFVRGIHRGPVNSLHKGPVTRKMFPFDDVIMSIYKCVINITNIKIQKGVIIITAGATVTMQVSFNYPQVFITICQHIMSVDYHSHVAILTPW